MSQLTDRELLARLVAFDSTSSRSNRPIADFVCAYLEPHRSIAIERFEVDDGAKVSVLARVGPDVGEHRSGLVLCGHLDTVPADEPDWTSDPYAVVERDGALYARGACDMKGSVAIAMNRLVDWASRTPAHPLWLLLTHDEELGSLGAEHVVTRWPDPRPFPRNVLIGEPTSLRAVRMHKGHLKMRITVAGRGAHSGSPHLGRNAIEPAGPILVALDALRDELARERCETSAYFPEVPFVAINVARIAGGTALNVVPEQCVIELGVRPLPGDVADALAERVTTTVRRAVAGTERADDVDVAIINDNPPLLVDADAPLHRALTQRLAQRDSFGVSFSSDGGWLARGFDADCILFGPGAIEVAHRPDEHVPIREFDEAACVVDDVVEMMCG